MEKFVQDIIIGWKRRMRIMLQNWFQQIVTWTNCDFAMKIGMMPAACHHLQKKWPRFKDSDSSNSESSTSTKILRWIWCNYACPQG